MRVIVALFACIIAVSMAVPDFTEDVEPQMQDMELLEVQNEVQATIAAMKKKGVTHADCKDLAKTSCKEVEREVSTDQSLLNKLKSGRHCMKEGVHSEKKALTHWNKEKRYHLSMIAKVTEARNTKVSISSQTYGTLRRGKCGWIFGSRSYLRVRASYNHAVKVEILARGRVREAEKSYTRMVEMRKRQQYECHCTTKKAATKMWKVVTNKKRKVRQDKAYAKCKMMTCVLDGTKLTHRSCKGKLKTLKNKRLYSVTARTNCSGHKTPSDKVAPADPCKKWQAEKKANAEVAKALRAQVSFGGGSTVIKAQGKRTLDKAAAVLRKYPWMTITVTGHSDAPKGRRCTQLVIGRAAATEKYLKSKGCKNKMTRPVGKCGKKRAIEIIANAAGQRSPPKGCGGPRAPARGKPAAVYQHCNFGGYKKVLKHSTNWVAKLGIKNDDLSSIKVPKGKCVTLYEHSNYKGKSWKICGHKTVKCFVHHRNGGMHPSWNDRVSSIRVTNDNRKHIMKRAARPHMRTRRL